MGTLFRDYIQEKLEIDPELHGEYERLGPRFDAISELIRARQRMGLSQSELARRMKVKANVVSRLESGEHSPRLDTLAAAAQAMECELRVKFVRPRKAREVGPRPRARRRRR